MLLPLKFYPHKALRAKLKRVNYKKDIDFIKNMIPGLEATMEHMNGAGLAANQVGLNMAFALINPAADERYPDAKPYIIINPKIKKQSEPVQMEEGCLSCPMEESHSEKAYKKENKDWINPLRIVERYNKVTVEYTDINGKKVTKTIDGKLAQIFQHEIGHIEGKLYIDLLSPQKRQMAIKKIQKGIRKMFNPGAKRTNFKNRRSTAIWRLRGQQ